MTRKPSIGLVVFPLKSPDYECGQMYLTQMIRIIAPFSEKVTVITRNYCPTDILPNVELIDVMAPNVKTHEESVTSKIYRLILAQFTISLKLIQMNKRLDTIILFFGTGFIFLPTIVARIQKKRIIVITTGSLSKSTKALYSSSMGTLFYSLIWSIEQLNYRLADKITVGSDNMIKDLDIDQYRKKVLSNKATAYLDTNFFKQKQSLPDRDNIIGYIGRLCFEKGVIEFAKAIPLILSNNQDVKFLIVGAGPLMNEMKKCIEQSGNLDKVVFTGWVSHDKIPYYLNLIKFHVLPSYTEALGGTNLEAMACGAISIVNNVGGLSDVVIDGKTGFVLEDNSPQTIAKKIEKIFTYSDMELEVIQRQANLYIKENFTFERVVENWRDVICD